LLHCRAEHGMAPQLTMAAVGRGGAVLVARLGQSAQSEQCAHATLIGRRI
jgi:hypothetical protein